MPAPNALADIAAALTAFAPARLRASSLTLLAALGYRSDRTLPIPGAPDPAAFRSLAGPFAVWPKPPPARFSIRRRPSSPSGTKPNCSFN